MNLKNQKCVLATSQDISLSIDKCLELKKELREDWILDQENMVLTKTLTFKNFREPLQVLLKISKMAEEQNHHPVLKLAYGLLEISIWTHKVNGLLKNDFIFAAKIDEIYEH